MDKRFDPLVFELDRLLAEKTSVRLAIEGMCTSGKTTLAKDLAGRFDCAVIHMDDFFLRPEQRTEARYAEVGGNIDRERFLADVLEPLERGGEFSYRPYDCHKAKLAEPVTVLPSKLYIIEGSYSMHPALAGYYDLSTFLSVSQELQRERVFQRPEFLHQSFFERWIPMENQYFVQTNARARCRFAFDCD